MQKEPNHLLKVPKAAAAAVASLTFSARNLRFFPSRPARFSPNFTLVLSLGGTGQTKAQDYGNIWNSRGLAGANQS
jgi:hypothetical protein